MSPVRTAALLRGVNVGGVAMPMADVRARLTDAGAGDVRTFLASGNVVFDPPDGVDAATLIGDALRDRFGYDSWILVRPLTRIRAIADAFPFDTDESVHHPYVTFADDPVLLAELAATAEGDEPGSRARLEGEVLYWECPRGATLSTPLSKAGARARYAATTTRNLRTLRKLA